MHTHAKRLRTHVKHPCSNSEFRGLLKHQNNPACTGSVRAFKLLKLDSIQKQMRETAVKTHHQWQTPPLPAAQGPAPPEWDGSPSPSLSLPSAWTSAVASCACCAHGSNLSMKAQRVSNLGFYAQSTATVTSGWKAQQNMQNTIANSQ